MVKSPVGHKNYRIKHPDGTVEELTDEEFRRKKMIL